MSVFDTTVRAPRTRNEQRERLERIIERRHLLRPTEGSIKRATSLLYTWEHVAAMCGISSTVLDHVCDLPALVREACYSTDPDVAFTPQWPADDATERAISGQMGPLE